MKHNLPNVRLSFPSLFQHASFSGESTGKYEATFILDKVEHKDQIDKLRKAIKDLCETELKSKVGADRICLKDGDESGRDEFAGKYTIKASTKRRPVLIDKDKSPLVEDDGRPYAGCYVNAILSLWPQNNAYGKRINAQLDGVQFHGDGDAFGDAGISVDAFDAFGGDDEEIPF